MHVWLTAGPTCDGLRWAALLMGVRAVFTWRLQRVCSARHMMHRLCVGNTDGDVCGVATSRTGGWPFSAKELAVAATPGHLHVCSVLHVAGCTEALVSSVVCCSKGFCGSQCVCYGQACSLDRLRRGRRWCWQDCTVSGRSQSENLHQGTHRRESALRARAKPRAVPSAKARTKAKAKATQASSTRCRGRSSQPSTSDSEESTSESSSASSSTCPSDPSSAEVEVLVERPTVGVAIAEHCGRAFGRELAAQAQAPAAQVSFWSTAVSSAPSPTPGTPCSCDSYELDDRSLRRRSTAAPKMLVRAGYRCPSCFGLLRNCRPSCKGSEFRGPSGP